MQTDSRLSRMLHVLLHMARHDEPFTSQQIAKMLNTNAALVRRTMAGLRNAGYVSSINGRKGGWTISCNLEKVTLSDIYNAVGQPRLIALGIGTEGSQCAVEKSVMSILDKTFNEAEKLIHMRLMQITLADVLNDFNIRCLEGGWTKDGPTQPIHTSESE